MENGGLVNDEVAHELCVVAIQSVASDCNGLILDGYPRTTNQAKLLDDYVRKTGDNRFQFPVAVNIVLEKWVAVQKLLGILFSLI